MSTTHNDMPMCEAPLIVAEVYETVTVRLRAAEAAERGEGWCE
jgi:hypothetical protein